MAIIASELIGKLMEELRTIAKTETIMGKEIQVGEVTLIPVSQISLGIGAGGGQGSDNKRTGDGGGGGGGVMVTPVAFIAIKGGEVSFHGLKKGGFFDALVEQLPELTEKIMSKVQDAEAKKEEPEAG
jgi:uncharacterized spore protein YtfJ